MQAAAEENPLNLQSPAGDQIPITATAARISGPASLVRRTFRSLGNALDWFFGLGAIVAGLAILSVIPVLNFLSLGYLLECSGRVARSGRIRDGFVGIRKASVLASIAIGTWLILLPVRFASGMWKDAELIAPGSATARGWRIALIVLTVLALAHFGWAWLRGGRLWHFLWPAPMQFRRWLFKGGKFARLRDTVLGYLSGLRLPYYFWLGLRGFSGAVVWLIVPVGILIGATQAPNPAVAGLISILGGALLVVVVIYLPFLQAHFARTNRSHALFEVGEVRRLFRNAPIAFWTALFVTLLFALPLYLLKIELPPREAAWLPSVLFVVFIFPARLLTGWAIGRAVRRERPRNFLLRWLSRIAVLPVVVAYVFLVYLTQYLSWNGSLSLLDQHAFLVPAPLIGL